MSTPPSINFHARIEYPFLFILFDNEIYKIPKIYRDSEKSTEKKEEVIQKLYDDLPKKKQSIPSIYKVWSSCRSMGNYQGNDQELGNVV